MAKEIEQCESISSTSITRYVGYRHVVLIWLTGRGRVISIFVDLRFLMGQPAAVAGVLKGRTLLPLVSREWSNHLRWRCGKACNSWEFIISFFFFFFLSLSLFKISKVRGLWSAQLSPLNGPFRAQVEHGTKEMRRIRIIIKYICTQREEQYSLKRNTRKKGNKKWKARRPFFVAYGRRTCPGLLAAALDIVKWANNYRIMKSLGANKTKTATSSLECMKQLNSPSSRNGNQQQEGGLEKKAKQNKRDRWKDRRERGELRRLDL